MDEKMFNDFLIWKVKVDFICNKDLFECMTYNLYTEWRHL